MDYVTAPEAIQRLNDLWAKIRPRLEAVDTAADFLAPAAEQPPETTVNEPCAPEFSEPAVPAAEPPLDYVCFESADDAVKRQLTASVARELALENKYACLAAWAPDRRASRLFITLKTRQRALARRLSSACYLLTGQRPAKPEAAVCKPTEDWLPETRALFFEEAHAAERYRLMAGQCADPCLCELTRRSYTAKKEAAEALMGLMEEALSEG